MPELPRLNLPPFEPRLLAADNEPLRIYCPLRGRYVALTPEEWVRQSFVNWLIGAMGYPAAMLGNEVSLRLNGTQRRSDTVVYSPAGLTPLMVIEYKRPSVAITAKVFSQVVRYNSVLRTPFIAVSNGMNHYCCRRTEEGNYEFVTRFPTYTELLIAAETGRPE